ncbi:MAG: ATP-binding protein [Eubacteriales bacterium]|nr:ATP-binding protein [Eubacteriales bacterium]
MEIIKGKIEKAKKVVIYGPEGIGKSTFASQFPGALFIDTEGSTADMDVSRTPKPSSWNMLKQQVNEIKAKRLCETLIVDTTDWAEQLCVEDLLARYQKTGIEDFGYGNGWVYLKEEFGRFLNLLQDVVDSGINVVLTAHAQIRKFEQPDEMGAYDRFELKLGKKTSSQTSPLVKEWADALLFCNYKTYSVAADKDGKKHKAQGGRRTIYTSHHPCWDAKNRWGLPEELPFEYDAIAHCIPAGVTPTINAIQPAHEEVKAAPDPIPTEMPQTDEAKPEAPEEILLSDISKALVDLMVANQVSYQDIQKVVSLKGYYPHGTPIEKYDSAFIDGVLVGAWDQVVKMIEDSRTEDDDMPF